MRKLPNSNIFLYKEKPEARYDQKMADKANKDMYLTINDKQNVKKKIIKVKVLYEWARKSER